MQLVHSDPKMNDALSKDKPSVGLVIFSKNEARAIGPLIDEVKKFADEQDIFVMDGHSTDHTEVIAKGKNVNFLLDPKSGKGGAIRSALSVIERDILIFMDADGSHRPEEVPLLLDKIRSDKEVDMVIASRFRGGSEEFSGSPGEVMRFVGNMVSVFIINLIWGSRLTEVQNGFRAVRRKTLLELGLSENSFAIEQEMVMKCLKSKKKIAEVASHELRRAYGESHIVPHKMLPRYIMSFIKNII